MGLDIDPLGVLDHYDPADDWERKGHWDEFDEEIHRYTCDKCGEGVDEAYLIDNNCFCELCVKCCFEAKYEGFGADDIIQTCKVCGKEINGRGYYVYSSPYSCENDDKDYCAECMDESYSG